MFIIAVVSGAIHTEEPLGQAGCCPERADGMGQAKGHAAGWYLPVSHQTITPCTRLVTGQLQLPAAPSTGINLPLASRHRLGGCPSPQTAYTLKKPVSLIFCMRKVTDSPALFTSSPRSQEGDETFSTSSDTILLSLCPTWGCFLGNLIFHPWSPRLGSGWCLPRRGTALLALHAEIGLKHTSLLKFSPYPRKTRYGEGAIWSRVCTSIAL